jgi:hypothetical protein
MSISLSKKTLALAALTILIVGGGVFAYVQFKDDKSTSDTPERPIGSKDTIEYVPATEEEKEFSDSKKDELIEQEKKARQDAQSGQKKTIAPIITNATQSSTSRDLTVTAYIPGIAEETGTCTLTLSRGSQNITKTAAGFANVSNTNCEAFTVARSEFSEKGTWTATVSYVSAATTGTSQSKKIEIQ